jgi:hypothetical protein
MLDAIDVMKDAGFTLSTTLAGILISSSLARPKLLDIALPYIAFR